MKRMPSRVLLPARTWDRANRLRLEQLEDRVLLAADMFEPNGTRDQATVLGQLEQYHMGLTIDTARDQDWYSWNPINGGRVTATISFAHKAGDLGLEILDAKLQLLGRSDSATNSESVTWDATPNSSYLVHVSGVGGATQADYDLYLDMPRQWIGADRLEGRLGNDDFATASNLETAAATLKSLTLDFDQIEGVVDPQDYFRWVAPVDGTFTVDVLFRHDLGNVDAQLYDARQRLLSGSVSADDNERLSWDVTAKQLYYVRVFGANGAASPGYDLTTGFAPAASLFISDVTDQSTNEDVATAAIPFTIRSSATPLDQLVVTATSDNLALVSVRDIALSGSGGQHAVAIKPAPDRSGAATITLAVQSPDGQRATDSFVLTVGSVNDAPVNAVPGAQTVEEDTRLVFSRQTGNAISTSDRDVGDAMLSVVLSAAPGAVKLATSEGLETVKGDGTSNVAISGNLAAINRALDGLAYTPPPTVVAEATLTIVTNDLGGSGSGGPLSDTDAVKILIRQVSDPLVISPIPDQETTEGQPTSPAGFTISGGDVPLDSLLVNAASSNRRLVPTGNISLKGEGGKWTVAVTPAAHQIGEADIVITVDNRQGTTARQAFRVTVRPLPDTDRDGLPDLWETKGLDWDGDGTVDLNLSELGADPRRKDLFVELDAMAGRSPHPLDFPNPDVPAGLATGTVLDDVIAAFLVAPVSNPDGTTGIDLHLQLDETNIPRQPFSLGWKEYDVLKCGEDRICSPQSPPDGHFGTPSQRASANWGDVAAAKSLVYRYAMFADRRGTDGAAGLAERPGNDLIVTLGDWITPAGQPGGTPQQQAGTFMHELGHNLGLAHGGADETNYKPNYFSVMNYHWQVPTMNTGWRLDYSRQQLATLDEANLKETAGVGFAAGSIPGIEQYKVHVGPSFQMRVPLVGPADWNGDGDTGDLGSSLDVNNDGVIGQLAGYNDWENLRFTFRDVISFDDGVHACSGSEDCEDVDEQTDFDPVNAYAVLEDAYEPNDTPDEVDDLADLETEDIMVDASVHASSNDDWYRWTAPIEGILEVLLEKDQDAQLDLALALHDEDGGPISIGTVIGAGDDEVVQIESEVDSTAVYFVSATSPDKGYYQLRVDTPEVWDGDAAVGSAGDGTQWGDADNWTVDGISDDRGPDETDHVTFDVASGSRSVNLGGTDRLVRSLTFLGDYTLADGTLDVLSGRVSVEPGATTTFQSDLAVPSGIVKTGEGTLVVNGQLGGLNEVSRGTLAGTGTLSNLLVQAGGNVSPGQSIGTLTVSGAVTILGSLAAEVGGSGADRINSSGAVNVAGGSLVVHALSSLQTGGGQAQIGDTTRTLIAGSSIAGTFALFPAAGQHAGAASSSATFPVRVPRCATIPPAWRSPCCRPPRATSMATGSSISWTSSRCWRARSS